MIDISIDPCEGPSIVQQSLPEPTTSFVPRQESDASPSEDFIPIQSSQSHHGPRTDLEVEETSDSEVEESLQRRFFQIINSPEHFDALVRRSINYTKPKQTKTRKRLRYESNLSSDSEDEPSETESEAIEELCACCKRRCEEPDSEFERSNPLSGEETRHDMQMQMTSDEMSDLRRQVMDIQQHFCRQFQTAIEGATVPEPALAKPTLFHGYENENVDRWLQRFKLYLTNRRVNPESDQAAIQIALHLQGPAESYYYNLPSDVQSSFRCLRNALKERFSPAHRSLRLRQELSVRRQGSNESIEKYLTDLNDKFSCLDLRDEDKLSYLIQGLRPDIQADVLRKNLRHVLPQKIQRG